MLRRAGLADTPEMAGEAWTRGASAHRRASTKDRQNNPMQSRIRVTVAPVATAVQVRRVTASGGWQGRFPRAKGRARTP